MHASIVRITYSRGQEEKHSLGNAVLAGPNVVEVPGEEQSNNYIAKQVAHELIRRDNWCILCVVRVVQIGPGEV